LLRPRLALAAEKADLRSPLNRRAIAGAGDDPANDRRCVAVIASLLSG
jgi:hypothetical protein